MVRKGFTFDDVLCVPKKSSLRSRKEVNLGTRLGELSLGIPIISSPMDTVTWIDMAMFMHRNGGLGILHRYCSIDEQVDAVRYLKNEGASVGAAVGVNGDAYDRAIALVEAGVDVLCLDIAHGHTVHAIDMAAKMRHDLNVPVISGNICTAEAAGDYISSGVHILRVGIGGGSSCSTRVVAGVGVPQLTAIMDVASVGGAYIIADGGIRNSGDIVKALAAGADAVMLGGLLAAYPVAAGEYIYEKNDPPSLVGQIFNTWREPNSDDDAAAVFSSGLMPITMENMVKKKIFRGMASKSALSERDLDDIIIEGEEFYIDVDYDFDETFRTLLGGVRAGLAYLGAATIGDLHDATVDFIEITSNGFREGLPHMKL